MKRSVALIAGLAVLLSVTACGKDDPGSTNNSFGVGDKVTTTDEPTDTPECGAEGASLEGCFTDDTIEDYVNIVLPMMTNYVNDTWKQLPAYDVVFVAHGEEGQIGCADGEGNADIANDESYAYCPPDATIYVGQASVWQLYDEQGDAAPAVGIAHELGHHVQAMVGVPSPTTTEEAVVHENQADCIAGTWTAWANDKGIMEYPDDLQDIGGLMQVIASAEGPGRDHGTLDERTDSFVYGYEHGLSGCSEYYPNTPLLTQ
jgi:predicted metalloprotease